MSFCCCICIPLLLLQPAGVRLSDDVTDGEKREDSSDVSQAMQDYQSQLSGGRLATKLLSNNGRTRIVHWHSFRLGFHRSSVLVHSSSVIDVTPGCETDVKFGFSFCL